MLAKYQVLWQEEVSETDSAESSDVTAQCRKDPLHLMVSATRDRDGGKHCHSVRSHEARMRAAASNFAQVSDVGLVAVRWSRRKSDDQPVAADAAGADDPLLQQRLDDELRDLD